MAVSTISRRFREQRMDLLRRLTAGLPRPISILDVGGTIDFWTGCTDEYGITLINQFPQPSYWKHTCLIGDACSLPFPDHSFDVVFSNSVIGHVGGWDRQTKMAHEIRRVGRSYFIQTPNHHFPIDWRTMVPFFHWLSPSHQAWCLCRFRVGKYLRCSAATALWLSTRVRNVTYGEIQRLFPGAIISREKLVGLTKSFVIHCNLPLLEANLPEPLPFTRGGSIVN
jgi:SAM-dependent methyltransferase